MEDAQKLTLSWRRKPPPQAVVPCRYADRARTHSHLLLAPWLAGWLLGLLRIVGRPAGCSLYPVQPPTNRLTKMGALALTIALNLAVSSAELALPSAKQLDFQTNHPIGCFFHFGINTFTGQEHGSGDSRQPPSKFGAPASLDTDQWVQACVALGGTYAVFTAKHEEGMMNWPSNATNYTIAESPFCAARKRLGRGCDIVAEFLLQMLYITRGQITQSLNRTKNRPMRWHPLTNTLRPNVTKCLH